MKAKLINGRIEYEPNTVIYNNVKYCGGVPEDILTALGYKELIDTPMPDVEYGYHAELHYEDAGDAIEKVWTIVENSAESKIEVLKQKLFDTDYQAIKYAEGWIEAEDYAEMRTQRQEWRDEINALEGGANG